jgi:hypothetical protein
MFQNGTVLDLDSSIDGPAPKSDKFTPSQSFPIPNSMLSAENKLHYYSDSGFAFKPLSRGSQVQFLAGKKVTDEKPFPKAHQSNPYLSESNSHLRSRNIEKSELDQVQLQEYAALELLARQERIDSRHARLAHEEMAARNHLPNSVKRPERSPNIRGGGDRSSTSRILPNMWDISSVSSLQASEGEKGGSVSSSRAIPAPTQHKAAEILDVTTSLYILLILPRYPVDCMKFYVLSTFCMFVMLLPHRYPHDI